MIIKYKAQTPATHPLRFSELSWDFTEHSRPTWLAVQLNFKVVVHEPVRVKFEVKFKIKVEAMVEGNINEHSKQTWLEMKVKIKVKVIFWEPFRDQVKDKFNVDVKSKIKV